MRWLFDIVAIVAMVLWRRRRRRPALRLVVASPTPRPALRSTRRGVVAVLVSTPSMEARVRSAIGWRTVLRFAHTWAELEQLVNFVPPPMAVFADPLTDRSGDPEGHLDRLIRELHMPVILYTTLSPEAAGVLLGLGQRGIRHVLFNRYDDSAERFNTVFDSVRVQPPNQPPFRAA